MPTEITRINGINPFTQQDADATVNGVPIGNIDTLNASLYPEPTSYALDDLFLYYDPTFQNTSDVGFVDQVYSQQLPSPALTQSGHDAGTFNGNLSTPSSLITTLTIDGAATNVMYFDGVNDFAYKKAYSTPISGSGGNHGINTYGVGPTSSVGTTINVNSWDATGGFTWECFWRSNGSFNSIGNLWSSYQNAGMRMRIKNSNKRKEYIYRRGAGGTATQTRTPTRVYSTNTWYHDVTTWERTSQDVFTLKNYINGTLDYTNTNNNMEPLGFTQDRYYFAASHTPNSAPAEVFKGYFGLVRLYQKPLSLSEVQQNYDFNKSRFGLT